MRYVIGIDPGQTMGGMALFVDGELLRSCTVRPWSGAHLAECVDYLTAPVHRKRVKVFYEVPQNGTHSSRGGVQFGAGMYVQALRNRLSIARSAKTGIYPRTWRAYHVARKKPADWKRWAIRTCKRKYQAKPASDDEAEAILIAAYGAEA